MTNKKLTTSVVASLLLATNLYSNELSSIIVTSATKSEQSIKDVTSNIEVITKEELEEKNFTNVSEALNTISGIDITSNGGFGQTSFVRINGMHYTNTLVLIDGIRYNDITNGSAFPENILVSDIERIEIIKGAQSGIWGADASGGVVNIITKTAKSGFAGNINAEYGSFNTKKLAAGLSIKKEKFYAKLNANKVESNGFSSIAPKGVDVDSLEDDSYENTTLSVKAGYNFNDSNKIDLSHIRIYSENEYDGGAWDDSLLDQANNNTYSATSKSRFSKINFNHIDNFNNLNIYASQSFFKREYPSGYTTLYKGDIKEYGINSKISYGKKDFVLIGLDRKEFEQDKSYEIDYSNNGLFLTNSNSFNNGNTVLTESLRYDKYTSFKNKITGKIGFKHTFNDFVFSSNYGTGYKAPSLYQLSNDGGNDLKPEYNKSFDVALGYKDLEVRYFKNKIDDLIEYNYNGTQFDYSDDYYSNVEGTSNLRGYEVSYNNDITQNTLLSLSYTNLIAKDKDKERLLRVPKETVKLSLDYYGIEDFHFNLNGKYIGDREDLNDVQTGKYTVWNSVVNYTVNKDTSVYLKIDNIFDKYYQTVSGYASAKRSAYVGLKYSF